MDNTLESYKLSLVNGANIGHNVKGLLHCRVASGIIAGLVAGMFSFTSIYGILIFLIFNVAMSGILYAIHAPSPSNYLLKNSNYFTQSMFSGMLSFILAWVLAYDIVNIFA